MGRYGKISEDQQVLQDHDVLLLLRGSPGKWPIASWASWGSPEPMIFYHVLPSGNLTVCY